jgi:hypothetical protein
MIFNDALGVLPTLMRATLIDALFVYTRAIKSAVEVGGAIKEFQWKRELSGHDENCENCEEEMMK